MIRHHVHKPEEGFIFVKQETEIILHNLSSVKNSLEKSREVCTSMAKMNSQLNRYLSLIKSRLLFNSSAIPDKIVTSQKFFRLETNILNNDCRRNMHLSHAPWLFATSCLHKRSKSKQSLSVHDPKNPILKNRENKWADHMDNPVVKEILDNTVEVVDERESAVIVSKILAMGKPIGVDMEGHNHSVVQLVQIKAADDQIYLFRTGINPKLIHEGKLKNLLENRNIVKVLHAGAGDCMEIYKDGVKMENVYDTALAHGVIEYQNNGKSLYLYRGQIMGFNRACEIYGLPMNPMKMDMKKSNMLWARSNIYAEPVLNDEIKAYSAFDVEPLIDLYEITRSMISEDLHPLLKDLCEYDIIRNADPNLLKLKGNQLKEREDRTLFFRKLNSKELYPVDGVGKVDVYEFLSTCEGLKEVYFSGNTAHVIMPSRQSAILLYQSLTRSNIKSENMAYYAFREKFGASAEVILLSDADSAEILSARIETTQSIQRLKEDNYIIDNSVIRNIVDVLLKLKNPVIMEFEMKEGAQSINLFTGKHPVLKFQVNSDTITNGLGELMSSNSIVKVVPRIGVNIVYEALRLFTKHGFTPVNFFDLCSASNALDYTINGYSIFSGYFPPIKECVDRLGIDCPTKMEDYFYTYYQLVNNLLPSMVMKLLHEKFALDTEIGSNVSIPDAKERKKQLKLKYETFSAHISLSCATQKAVEPTVALKSIITTILEENQLEYEEIDVFDTSKIIKGNGAVGLVKFPRLHHPDDPRKFIELVNNLKGEGKFSKSLNLSNASICAAQIDVNKGRLDSWDIAATNLPKLLHSVSKGLEDLDNNGFIDIINNYKTINQQTGSE